MMYSRTGILLVLIALAGCANLSNRDPLMINVAGIEQVPGEGMELVLAVRLRVQNPNDTPVDYNGVAVKLDINGHALASGVSDDVGVVPRYGETVFTIPVTISAFNVARQIYGSLNADNPNEVSYELSGKLEGGLFGTRRFSDAGLFTLTPPPRAEQQQDW